MLKLPYHVTKNKKNKTKTETFINSLFACVEEMSVKDYHRTGATRLNQM